MNNHLIIAKSSPVTAAEGRDGREFTAVSRALPPLAVLLGGGLRVLGTRSLSY